MLAEDAAAFVEALKAPTAARQVAKHKRELAQATLELIQASWEVHALEAEFENAKRALAAGDYSALPPMRRLRAGLTTAALEQEVAAARTRLKKKHREAGVKRTRIEALEQEAQERSELPTKVTMYRLHSTRHHVSCSERRYAYLSETQRVRPVWVTTVKGRRWWWYLDRFWWDDERLSAREIKSIVLNLDLDSRDQHDAFERARAEVFEPEQVELPEQALPEPVRKEVWQRDRGHCVDCGADGNLAFDYILPLWAGGTTTAPNIELRCQACQSRRRGNEVSATVSQARVSAQVSKDWGMELAAFGWPRAASDAEPGLHLTPAPDTPDPLGDEDPDAGTESDKQDQTDDAEVDDSRPIRTPQRHA